MPVARSFAQVIHARFDARPLALSRIAVGLAAACQGILTWKLVIAMHGEGIARARVFPALPDLSLNAAPFYLIAWLIASLGFTVGLFTTFMGTLLAGVIAYQLTVDMNLYSNHVYLLFLSVTLLTVAKSGAAISIDRFLSHGPPALTVPYVPVFLLRYQVSVMYFFTAIQKINLTFLSGTVLQRSLIFGAIINFPALYRAMSAIVIIAELFLAIGLWIKPLRRWVFLFGFIFHAIIPVFMLPNYRYDLMVFSTISVGLYFTFLPGAGEALIVVWDDYCSFCAGWIRVVRALDWLHRLDVAGSSDQSTLERLNLTREETDLEIKAISQDGTLGGYDAIVRILSVLPVSLFWAPALELPPVRAIGRRAYRWIAVRRKCTYASRPHPMHSTGTS